MIDDIHISIYYSLYLPRLSLVTVTLFSWAGESVYVVDFTKHLYVAGEDIALIVLGFNVRVAVCDPPPYELEPSTTT